MAGIIMMLLLFVISLALDEKVVNLFYTSKTVIILISYSGCIGALALWEVPMTDSSFMPRFVFIDEVSCYSSESTLLNCSHLKRGDSGFECCNGSKASIGVSCREEELKVDSNMRASIITGAVLGSIIAVLLLLLVVCGGALLYLLRSRDMISIR